MPPRPRCADPLGVLLLLATTVGWGANWPALKRLLTELPPLAARGWSGLAGALLLAAIAVACGESLRVPRAEWRPLLVAAFLNVTAWMGFATLGLWWLGAGEAAIVAYTMPVWAALLAWPVLGERPTPRRLAALALGLLGVVLLLGAGARFEVGKLPGMAVILLGSVLFALGTVLTKRRAPALPATAGVAWQIGLGCLPLALLSPAFEQPDLAALSAPGWAFLAYMAVGPLCLCYLAWFAALRRLPAGLATTGTLLAPVVGVLLGTLLLGEPLGWRLAAALGLTVTGVLLGRARLTARIDLRAGRSQPARQAGEGAP